MLMGSGGDVRDEARTPAPNARPLRHARAIITGVGAAAFTLVLLLIAPEAANSQTAPATPEPDGYRMDEYRAPTPATLKGAVVIDTPDARRLHAAGVAFVDVMPRAPKPKGLPAGTIWHPKPRSDIPGSLWLVDTGYGALAPIMEDYFLRGLSTASKNDKGAPLVFYCQRDCWMSWNAARRAVAAGYTGIHWYPEGTDGWAQAGLPLVVAEPARRPDE